MKLSAKAAPACLLLFFSVCSAGDSPEARPGRVVGPDAAIRRAEIAELKLLPDVTVKLGLIEPTAEPKGVILMLPGGNGAGVHSFSGLPEGKIELGGNFVVRTAPDFARLGYVVVMMNAPSDMPDGIGQSFRRSKRHHQDLAKIIGYLKGRYAKKPLYAASFCISNASLTSLTVKNAGLPLAGLILISGTWQGAINHGALDKMSSLPYSTLVVHHKDNKCNYCLSKGTRAFFKALRTKGRKSLIMAEGGTPGLEANVCGPFHYHGFEGIEAKVVAAIVDWMDGKEPPKELR